MKTSVLILLFFNLIFAASSGQTNQSESLSFVFMTDIHVEYGKNAPVGFKQALKKAESLKPDFILTGGDLIADALGQNYNRTDSLYNLYKTITSESTVPIYNTMGNHENFGWYKSSGVPRTHAEFGEKMFENRIGKRYYSFMHKGWCFIIFDSIEEQGEGNGYSGHISQEQIGWLKNLLGTLNKETPIVVSTHIPFITANNQLTDSSLAVNTQGDVIKNSKDVYNILKDYNLKMVLQGHLHIYEDLFLYDTHFITGGAISAAWWTGPYKGIEEGFLQVNITGNDFTSDYIDYGWEP